MCLCWRKRSPLGSGDWFLFSVLFLILFPQTEIEIISSRNILESRPENVRSIVITCAPHFSKESRRTEYGMGSALSVKLGDFQ